MADDDFDQFVSDVLNPSAGPKDATARHLADLAESEPDTPHWAGVVISTTQSIPGASSVKLRGVVTARVAIGQRGLKVLKMQASDTFGTRSATLEGELRRMEQECFKQLKQSAFGKGANAIVGASLQFGELTGEASLLFCTGIGTAVIVE